MNPENPTKPASPTKTFTPPVAVSAQDVKEIASKDKRQIVPFSSEEGYKQLEEALEVAQGICDDNELYLADHEAMRPFWYGLKLEQLTKEAKDDNRRVVDGMRLERDAAHPVHELLYRLLSERKSLSQHFLRERDELLVSIPRIQGVVDNFDIRFRANVLALYETWKLAFFQESLFAFNLHLVLPAYEGEKDEEYIPNEPLRDEKGQPEFSVNISSDKNENIVRLTRLLYSETLAGLTAQSIAHLEGYENQERYERAVVVAEAVESAFVNHFLPKNTVGLRTPAPVYRAKENEWRVPDMSVFTGGKRRNLYKVTADAVRGAEEAVFMDTA